MLPVFRSLPIASEVHRAETLPSEASAYASDTLTLGWEERIKARGRRQSDGGAEFATGLPRGTTLREGDCLVLDELRLIVRVTERHEPVFVVQPRTPAEWGLYGYLIGNSHQPIMLTDGAIVCPDEPGMEQVLTQNDIRFSRSTKPFTPVSLLVDHRH